MPLLARLADRACVEIVEFCPEVDGGLSVPRSPAAIFGGDGDAVLDGLACVRTLDGSDVTAEFLAGAEAAVCVARRVNPVLVILKARSPSCGLRQVYRGTKDELRPGPGVAAALLRRTFPQLPLYTEEDAAESPGVRALLSTGPRSALHSP